MSSDAATGFMALRALRWTAWGLFSVWAAFWLWFNIASGIGEIAELGPMGLIMHLIMPALIIITFFVAWKWELAGGILLVAMVALFFARFGWGGWALALLLEAPPLLAGTLLAVAWWLAREAAAGTPAAAA